MICDSHIHVGNFFGGLNFTAEEIFYWTKTQKIDKFLFFLTASDENYASYYKRFLREVETLQSLAGYDVAFPALWLPLAELANLKKYWREDFVALKIHPAMENLATDSDYARAMSLALELQKPLIIHTGYDEAMSCLRFAKIAKFFPDLKLILAHGRPFEQCIEASKYSENIYFDTAYMPASEAEKLVNAGFGDRLIFGSDFPIDRHFFPNEDANIRYASFKDKMVKILPQTALSENFIKLF